MKLWIFISLLTFLECRDIILFVMLLCNKLWFLYYILFYMWNIAFSFALMHLLFSYYFCRYSGIGRCKRLKIPWMVLRLLTLLIFVNSSQLAYLQGFLKRLVEKTCYVIEFFYHFFASFEDRVNLLKRSSRKNWTFAAVVESADTRDLKSLDSDIVPVQVGSAAP